MDAKKLLVFGAYVACFLVHGVFLRCIGSLMLVFASLFVLLEREFSES
jgi:hypothetical protein